MFEDVKPLPFLNKGLAQVAIIVEDLDAAMEHYWKLFGVGPWHVYTYGPPLVKEMTYHGESTEYKMRVGLSYFGPMRIELIQPLEGDTVYADFVKEHGYGVHHFGLLVEDMEAELAKAEAAGLAMTMDGAGFGLDGDGHYAYLDTEDKLGVTLELIERPKGRVKPERIYPSITLAESVQRLNAAQIQWAVFAGAAASVYGASRPLTDVDILMSATEGHQLPDLFPEAILKHNDVGDVIGAVLPDIDIVAGVPEMDLDEAMVARLTYHDIQGVTVPVIPAEDNIVLKALWGRGPEQGKHDWDDVKAMLAHCPDLDWDYVRWRARQCLPQVQCAQLLEKLECLRLQKSPS